MNNWREKLLWQNFPERKIGEFYKDDRVMYIGKGMPYYDDTPVKKGMEGTIIEADKNGAVVNWDDLQLTGSRKGWFCYLDEMALVKGIK
jgi:hypothetical protein